MKVWKKGIFLVLTLGMTGGMFLTGTAQALDVPVDSSTFPDPAFLSYVQKRDTDGDGLLSQSERDAVTQMDLRKLGIQDLSGLEWFSALESLNCSENDLVSLELADFPALTSLTCNENSRLSELTLSGVPALEQLSCFHSNLSQPLCGRWPQAPQLMPSAICGGISRDVKPDRHLKGTSF